MALLVGSPLLATGDAAAESMPVLPRPFHVIAHRGASAEAPENTLPAFQQALALGVVEVELDVQLSSDGVPMLFHDHTLDEKTPLSGPVRSHTAEALARADVGSWFDREYPNGSRRWAGTTLTSLRQVLETFGERLRYHVEIKDELEATPARVIETVTELGLAQRVMLTSFHRAQLDRARERAPAIPVCWLLDGDYRDRIEAAAAAGFAMVGVRASKLTDDLVRRAHARGLLIRAFGVKTDADMLRAIATGCNGMTIDRPEWLVYQVMQRLQTRE
jgi:glycerophosphoryl diester phosphodiesterase